MLHQTRIQHLAEKAPYRVITENGQLYATTIGLESVHELMTAVDALTQDWTDANQGTFAPAPELIAQWEAEAT